MTDKDQTTSAHKDGASKCGCGYCEHNKVLADFLTKTAEKEDSFEHKGRCLDELLKAIEEDDDAEKLGSIGRVMHMLHRFDQARASLAIVVFSKNTSTAALTPALRLMDLFAADLHKAAGELAIELIRRDGPPAGLEDMVSAVTQTVEAALKTAGKGSFVEQMQKILDEVLVKQEAKDRDADSPN